MPLRSGTTNTTPPTTSQSYLHTVFPKSMTARTNRYEDDDASHLPPGMKRVGYDTDTERYTFREGDDLWLGEPGSFYGGRMKWAGKAPGTSSSKHSRGSESGDSSRRMEKRQFTASPAHSHFQEHVIKAHSYFSTNVGKRDDSGDWGVPVVSISATGAAPPDGAGSDGGLKRRASKLVDVAEMAAGALGLNRRWTKRRPTTEAAQREKVLLSSEKAQNSERSGRRSEESS